MSEENYSTVVRNIEVELEDIIKFDDFKRAQEFLTALDRFKNDKSKNINPEILKQINYYYNILKWIALPIQTERAVLEEFSNNFSLALEIPEYDLQKKIKHFLVGIPSEPDRDVIKEKIKSILNKNKEILTKTVLEGYVSSTIENWVKYYTSKMNLGIVGKFNLQEFYTSDNQIKRLNKDERARVMKFFDFYEFLKLSSLTVLGFEGTLPVNTDNFEGFIANGELSQTKKLDPRNERILRVVMGEDIYDDNIEKLGPPQTESERNIKKLQAEEENLPEDSLERAAIDEEVEKQKHLEELQYQASQYAEGSLERMALDEEINRLKK